MKKAVITTGGKQYLVSEGDIIDVDLLDEVKKPAFDPLLVIEDDKVLIGQPTVKDAKVSADVVEADFKAEKVLAIRYKAKKRVHKIHGHRQHHTRIKVTKIV